MKKKIHPHIQNQKQNGFTLIEFMIAMAMSLFCVLAMTGIYLSIKNGFFAQGNISSMQESERLALTSLNNTIQLSGYYLNPQNSNTQTAAFPVDSANGFAAGQYISSSATAGLKNTVSVKSQTAPNDGLLTCIGTGNTGTANTVFTNTFTFTANSAQTGTYLLQCAVYDDISKKSVQATLADNISSFNIAYGVDSDGDGNIDYYTTAITPLNPLWLNVKSVRISIAFADMVNTTAGNTPKSAPAIIQYINLMNNYTARNDATS